MKQSRELRAVPQAGSVNYTKVQNQLSGDDPSNNGQWKGITT